MLVDTPGGVTRKRHRRQDGPPQPLANVQALGHGHQHRIAVELALRVMHWLDDVSDSPLGFVVIVAVEAFCPERRRGRRSIRVLWTVCCCFLIGIGVPLLVWLAVSVHAGRRAGFCVRSAGGMARVLACRGG